MQKVLQVPKSKGNSPNWQQRIIYTMIIWISRVTKPNIKYTVTFYVEG